MVIRIFVSYAKSDGLDIAKNIKEFFEDRRYNVFVADEDIEKGETWNARIMKELSESNIVIILLTSVATESNSVENEYKDAEVRHKKIIPCKHKKVMLPWQELPWGIGKYQGIEFENTQELLRELYPSVKNVVAEISVRTVSLTVRIDKASYIAGETIRISGTVPAVLEGQLVAIQVFNPRNTMYTIARPTVNADGTFSYDFKIGGKLGIDGVYTVKATYSGQSVTATLTFSGGVPQPSGTMTVTVGDKKFNLQALLSNGSIQKIEVDQSFKSIVLTVSTIDKDGELTITLPRQLIDALKPDGSNDIFVVLVDGDEVDAKESNTTSTERTLTIPVKAGAVESEIIGTWIAGIVIQPEIVFDKNAYHESETMFITIISPDSNKDPRTVDEIQCLVTSSNDYIVLRLLETGPNTGIFVAPVNLVHYKTSNFDLAVGNKDLITVYFRTDTGITASKNVSVSGASS